MEISHRFRPGTRRGGAAAAATGAGASVEDLLAVVWRVLRNYPEAREALRVEVEGMLFSLNGVSDDGRSK